MKVKVTDIIWHVPMECDAGDMDPQYAYENARESLGLPEEEELELDDQIKSSEIEETLRDELTKKYKFVVKSFTMKFQSEEYPSLKKLVEQMGEPGTLEEKTEWAKAAYEEFLNQVGVDPNLLSQRKLLEKLQLKDYFEGFYVDLADDIEETAKTEDKLTLFDMFRSQDYEKTAGQWADLSNWSNSTASTYWLIVSEDHVSITVSVNADLYVRVPNIYCFEHLSPGEMLKQVSRQVHSEMNKLAKGKALDSVIKVGASYKSAKKYIDDWKKQQRKQEECFYEGTDEVLY